MLRPTHSPRHTMSEQSNYDLNDFLFDLKTFLEGRQEGEAIMLISLLEHRFGPVTDEIKQRIANTEGAILLVYAKRVLDAKSLEEVFETHRT